MKILTDPAFLNYVLFVLYTANGLRWLFAGQPAQALYWLAAFLITLAVTAQAKGWF